MKKIGLYIHIPFCKSKCYYCDFNSYSNKSVLIEKYVQALKKEIKEYSLEKYEIETVYIGGGTPSYIDENYIAEILKGLDLSNASEITIEVNPGTVNFEKLQKYYSFGINRLSIGLQSTDNKLLKSIGRIHTYEQFLETYDNARKVGFKNINVDLMLALPSQTLQGLNESVEKIVELKPEHISVYSLILEDGTILYDKYLNKELELPQEIEEREMYWSVNKYLNNNGYEHYEISNYATKGYKAIHNTNCWEQKEYIGVGAGASSFLENKRYTNSLSIEEYINNNKRNIEEVLDENSKGKEFVMLGLRKLDGINLNEFECKFGINFFNKFEKEYHKLQKEGLLVNENGYIKLSNKGIDLANIVWEEFV